MVIDMDESQIRTLDQVRAFLDGTLAVEFKPLAEDAARYRHIHNVLWRFDYHKLKRTQRGWVLQYLRATCGFSRAHLTRLVAQVLRGKPLVKHYVAPAQAFARRFTDADILLLARIDRQFGTLSGPGTAHLLRRAFWVYGDARYERLATISVSHLYNLRHSFRYNAERLVHTKTRPTALAIGVRKAPVPDGRPGFIRIDSVHRAIWTAPRASITSTPWTASPNGRSWARARASPRSSCCHCCGRCSTSSPSASWGFTPTTAASTSTIRSPRCWASCTSI
jgi:hypothetical protein